MPVILHIKKFNHMKKRELNDSEKHIIIDKGTEPPFSGEYWNHTADGIYLCRQCSAPLYRSQDKFDSGCGWPSFDDEIPGAVKRTTDADGRRTEITCSRCGGHLGHVFQGERLTPKNTRHCVNSLSMQFVPSIQQVSARECGLETAIFAGGCFWGVEYYMSKVPGVAAVESGYTGGKTANPSYEEVCSGRTGHAEAVRILFDPNIVTYEELVKLFLEIHDPEQVNRQGPDIGEQYRSEIFYMDSSQKKVAERLIEQLITRGYDVATRLTPAGDFWKAENYHQEYYTRKGTSPYCHKYTKRFD